MKTCPYCRQPMPIVRHGVRMSSLKAAIVDLVSSAGSEGILVDALIDRLAHPMSHNTLKVHISQINDLIETDGVMIVSRHHRKFLVRVEKRACL